MHALLLGMLAAALLGAAAPATAPAPATPAAGGTPPAPATPASAAAPTTPGDDALVAQAFANLADEGLAAVAARIGVLALDRPDAWLRAQDALLHTQAAALLPALAAVAEGREGGGSDDARAAARALLLAWAGRDLSRNPSMWKTFLESTNAFEPPEGPDLNRHGRARLAAGDAAGALALYGMAVAQFPKDEGALAGLIEAALLGGRLRTAADAAERLAARRPRGAPAAMVNLARGRAAAAAGRRTEAALAYADALFSTPNGALSVRLLSLLPQPVRQLLPLPVAGDLTAARAALEVEVKASRLECVAARLGPTAPVQSAVVCQTGGEPYVVVGHAAEQLFSFLPLPRPPAPADVQVEVSGVDGTGEGFHHVLIDARYSGSGGAPEWSRRSLRIFDLDRRSPRLLFDETLAQQCRSATPNACETFGIRGRPLERALTFVRRAGRTLVVLTSPGPPADSAGPAEGAPVARSYAFNGRAYVAAP